jgi:hypothetical protein
MNHYLGRHRDKCGCFDVGCVQRSKTFRSDAGKFPHRSVRILSGAVGPSNTPRVGSKIWRDAEAAAHQLLGVLLGQIIRLPNALLR